MSVPLRKTFRGNLTEAISFIETEVIFKVTSANEITSFRFPWKIFLIRKLTLKSKITIT